MNHNPLGTDPLKRSLFKKTEEVITSLAGEAEEVITPRETVTSPQVVLPELPPRLEVLTFSLGAEEFGIEINRVKEIVRLVEITPVPKAPNFIEGIIDVRGEIVPVISLKKMFALGEEKYTLHTQIIITEIEGGNHLPGQAGKRIIGLLADRTGEIISLGREKIKLPIETIPLHNFLFGIAEEVITSFGERLLLLLDLNKILSYEQKTLLEMLTSGLEKVTPVEDEEKKELTPEEKIIKDILHQRALELSKRKIFEEKEKKQIVIFSVEGDFYAVEINQVKEVVEARKIVYLPSAAVHLAGIINLRGELVPVLNLKELFLTGQVGLTYPQGVISPANNGKTRIVITEIGGDYLTKSIKVGLLVDKVYDVVSLTVDTFEPPLVTIEKGIINYLSAQAHWENKILGLLNLENIVKSI